MKKAENIIIGINLGDFGSTGVIMRNALEYAHLHGNFDYLVVVPNDSGNPNTFAYLTKNGVLDKLDRRLFHRSLGNPDGLFEYRATQRIIKRINKECKSYKNVIIHLHNIHMASIDFRYLFKYFAKQKKIRNVFYTIHDSWPYTGGCYVYKLFGCDEWKNGCRCHCVQGYGSSRFDVASIWSLKKEYSKLLIDKMTLFPVSNWINEEMNKSFLRDFKKIVINGETNIEKLNYRDEEIIKRYSLKGKKIILTISAYWNKWKGVDYIYDIADGLPQNYVLIVVGGKFDTRNKTNLIHVCSVDNKELSHYFSVADVYISTSQSESLGLTTAEAQICGVPVVAFGHTGIKETFNEKTGIAVGEDNDVNKMIKAIVEVVENKPFLEKDIISNGNKFSKYSSSKKYFDFYTDCLNVIK